MRDQDARTLPVQAAQVPVAAVVNNDVSQDTLRMSVGWALRCGGGTDEGDLKSLLKIK